MPELLGSTDYRSSIMVMGLLLQTYGSGSKDVAFATQPILPISPNGKSALLHISVQQRAPLHIPPNSGVGLVTITPRSVTNIFAIAPGRPRQNSEPRRADFMS